jgi:hypothetical protein
MYFTKRCMHSGCMYVFFTEIYVLSTPVCILQIYVRILYYVRTFKQMYILPIHVRILEEMCVVLLESVQEMECKR